ncbi:MULTISPECIES: nucleotidyltransferase domain-containing protein [unclassified Parabacteroides]|uniref:nucleotidyltransferase family protein n=1 Tax=unclassified Parabacteroides TaxID=2649774 RepID=UPI000EFFFEDD|nr:MULTISPECIES: nucleotidyltransferase domain-containing protein [unclassified Parabacteroides]RHO71561.1 nucleotidyltransferase [Parabacteroides sp. AF48-14]RHR54766.1 nucleotidyltransferase [Parabacteroides sp. AF17-28]
MRTRAEYLELLRCYKQQMAERYGIIRLGIFGSVSRNEQNIDSDLDVCVEMKEPDGFILLNIKYELEELLNCKIDIIRLRDNMNILLKRNIERDGIYV